MGGKHALLSPSGAHRWLACTPSAVLEYGVEGKNSEAAKEGTVAHALAELLLNRQLGRIDLHSFSENLKEIKKSEYYCAEMEEHILDYVSFVIDKVKQEDDGAGVVEVEAKLPLEYYGTDDEGTGDAVIIGSRTIHIIDLKYGKGVRVDAVDNPQMKIYALGALTKYGVINDQIEEVEMTIYQPRLDNISIYRITVDELVAWTRDELMPKASLANAGIGDFVAGEHCRFCKVKERCRAYAEDNLEMLKHDFAEPAMLSDDELTEIIGKSGRVISWLKSVEEYALREAISGHKWKGFKLVEGRSTRKYSDPDAVAKRLTDSGIPEAIIYEKSLLGITAMEKALTKKTFTELLSDLVVKPQGAPTLVEESDKRPELNNLQSAISDFSE